MITVFPPKVSGGGVPVRVALLRGEAEGAEGRAWGQGGGEWERGTRDELYKIRSSRKTDSQ